MCWLNFDDAVLRPKTWMSSSISSLIKFQVHGREATLLQEHWLLIKIVITTDLQSYYYTKCNLSTTRKWSTALITKSVTFDTRLDLLIPSPYPHCLIIMEFSQLIIRSVIQGFIHNRDTLTHDRGLMRNHLKYGQYRWLVFHLIP